MQLLEAHCATSCLGCRFIFQCDIIQGTPPALRKKAARLVGAKCTLLARMDAYGQARDVPF